jgi:hypothetical protein
MPFLVAVIFPKVEEPHANLLNPLRLGNEAADSMKPEERARERIDARLAGCG